MTSTSAPTRTSRGAILAAVALITGTLIGAGILALPINTGLAGFWPSMLAMVAVTAVMYLSAMILGEQAIKSQSATFDYPSLYESCLGQYGKWVAIVANLIIFYGILTAYSTGGGKILASLLGLESWQTVVMLVFTAPLIVLACTNLTFLERINGLLVLIMISAFGLLALMGAGQAQIARIRYVDWAFLPATLPIIITAFCFHNIIPMLSASLNWNLRLFRKAVIAGLLLALILNGLWIMVGIGVLPLTGDHSILASYEGNLPATVPMATLIHTPLFTLCASFFALTAICTSFLACGLGLQNFIGDLLANTFRLESRPLAIIGTFAPPLLIALIYPDIFLTMLNIVGGVGIVLLFVILPMLILLRDRSRPALLRRLAGLAGLLFALGILGVEIMQESGLLALHPDVEYHIIETR